MRYTAPKLYEQLQSVLEDFNMQPYDIEASIDMKHHHADVEIKFGEGYVQAERMALDVEEVSMPGERSRVFFREVVERSQKQWIADYFKMIKV